VPPPGTVVAAPVVPGPPDVVTGPAAVVTGPTPVVAGTPVVDVGALVTGVEVVVVLDGFVAMVVPGPLVDVFPPIVVEVVLGGNVESLGTVVGEGLPWPSPRGTESIVGGVHKRAAAPAPAPNALRMNRRRVTPTAKSSSLVPSRPFS
jgi:hypothetical protein